MNQHCMCDKHHAFFFHGINHIFENISFISFHFFFASLAVPNSTSNRTTNDYNLQLKFELIFVLDVKMLWQNLRHFLGAVIDKNEQEFQYCVCIVC